MNDSLKTDKKNFTKIQAGYIINLDWLDDVVSRSNKNEEISEEEQKELDRLLFPKAVLAVVLMINDNIAKVVVSQNNLQKIEWGQYNQCYLSVNGPGYVQDESRVPQAINTYLEMIQDYYPDLCIQIPAWKIKTFGFIGEPGLLS